MACHLTLQAAGSHPHVPFAAPLLLLLLLSLRAPALAESIPPISEPWPDSNNDPAASPRNVQLEGNGGDAFRRVATPEELLNAVNNDGVKHVVITSHMQLTPPKASNVVLSPMGTKAISGECLTASAGNDTTEYPLKEGQCILGVSSTLLATPEGYSMWLNNLYVRPHATLEASDPQQSVLTVYKSEVWMTNVTLEGGASGGLGVSILGTNSSASRALALGCVFRRFTANSGAAWNVEAHRQREDTPPVALSFSRCLFEHNQALDSGGAILLESGAFMRLQDCSFSENLAPYGHDIWAGDNPPQVFASAPVTVVAGEQNEDAVSLALSQAPETHFLTSEDAFFKEITEEHSELSEGTFDVSTLSSFALPAASAAAPAPAEASDDPSAIEADPPSPSAAPRRDAATSAASEASPAAHNETKSEEEEASQAAAHDSKGAMWSKQSLGTLIAILAVAVAIFALIAMFIVRQKRFAAEKNAELTAGRLSLHHLWSDLEAGSGARQRGNGLRPGELRMLAAGPTVTPLTTTRKSPAFTEGLAPIDEATCELDISNDLSFDMLQAHSNSPTPPQQPRQLGYSVSM